MQFITHLLFLNDKILQLAAAESTFSPQQSHGGEKEPLVAVRWPAVDGQAASPRPDCEVQSKRGKIVQLLQYSKMHGCNQIPIKFRSKVKNTIKIS